jgi:hypothetical protein
MNKFILAHHDVDTDDDEDYDPLEIFDGVYNGIWM